MKRIIALFVVVVLVIAGWSGAWFYFAGILRQQIVLQAQMSPSITCAKLGIGGYPFHFDITCHGFHMADGDFGVDVDEVRATAPMTQPSHIMAFFHGPAVMTDAFSGSRQEVDWSEAEASLRLDDAKLERFSLVAKDLQLFDTLIDKTLVASAQSAQLHVRDLPDKAEPARGLMTAETYFDAKGVSVPQSGVQDAEAKLDAEVTGLPDNVALWGNPDIIRLWQQAGGGVTLNSLSASDAQTSLNAKGGLLLDAEGRPEGQLALTSKGVVEQIGELLPMDLATAIVGKPDQEGNYSQTLTIKAGVFFVGILPVFTVGSLFAA